MQKTKTIQLCIGNYPKMDSFFKKDSKYKMMLKGRQVGGTLGTVNYCIELALSGKPMRILWIDTTYNMLNTYYHKYWHPEIKKIPKRLWDWRNKDKELKLFETTIIFKSYDRADAIEGDNFDLIVVNECGFLLKDSRLWEHTLAPMLLAKNGKAIFVGTPRFGKNSYYFKLVDSIEKGEKKDWHLEKFTSFDNPYLEGNIQDFIDNLDPESVKTEIYGEFPDANLTTFFHQFKFEKHVCNLNAVSNEPVYISFDFNVNPMTAIAFKLRRDGIEVLHEFYLENSDIHTMCEVVKKAYPHIAAVTGDASGANRSGNVKGLKNYYEVIISELGLRRGDVKVPRQNPTHHNSRILCNSILFKGDIKINASCKHLINDMVMVQIKPTGEIDKSNDKLTHVSDCFRYALNTFCVGFLKSL